jgi:predicted DNA-binding transcriptional regulator AlpA
MVNGVAAASVGQHVIPRKRVYMKIDDSNTFESGSAVVDHSPDGLLTLNSVAHLTGLSTTTIRRLINAGEFPAPIKISSATRWPTSEVAQFIEARKSARKQRTT